MKTLFVGGGAGCQAVLEMIQQNRLEILSLEILGVMDIAPEAPAMKMARREGWTTYTDIEEALAADGLELVVELTGNDWVREQVAARVPRGVRLMDHYMARVFWDLDVLAQHLRDELATKTELEKQSRRDHRQLQELLDSLPDLVMVVDEDGTIQRVNRRFEELTGLEQEEVLGRTCFRTEAQSGPGLGCDEATCPRRAVLESGQPLTMVQQNPCFGWGLGKGEGYYEVTATPTYNSQGGVSVVMTSREVTELVQLKRETEDAARRFDQIIGAVHGLITIKDLTGRYQLVNPAAERFSGLPEAAHIGKTAREIFPAEVAQIVEQNDQELMHTQRHTSHEEVFRIDGEEYTLISERVLLRAYNGAPVGICCVSRNVTEARRLQGELIQSEKHAALGKLAAGVAHELNNPLTGILTFAEELLDDTPEGDPARDDIEVIIHETLRCRQIVRDLLDFTRQTARDRRITTLDRAVRRAVGLVENQASFHDITFLLELHSVAMQVQADENQLQQVLLNLVINARDAMGGRGVIRLRTEDRPESGQVVLAVTDEGSGIESEALERIFEPFFTTKGDQGNGLGLAVVRSIIDQHGGTIEVDSQVDRGTTFKITLPGAKSRQGELERPPSEGE